MKQYKVKYKKSGSIYTEPISAYDMKHAADLSDKFDRDASDIISISVTKTPTGRPRSLDSFVLKEAAEIVVRDQYATVNYLCRKLGIGNARAGRIMDRLEELGIVGPFHGSKPREVLQKSIHYATALASGKATNYK